MKSIESEDNFPLKSQKYKKLAFKNKNDTTKEERILAHLYTYMIPITDYKIQDDLPEFLLFQKNNYSLWSEIEETLKCI